MPAVPLLSERKEAEAVKRKGLFRAEAAPSVYSTAEALQRVREGARAAEDCGYELSLLHCRGCINACRLTEVRCALGQRVADALRKDSL